MADVKNSAICKAVFAATWSKTEVRRVTHSPVNFGEERLPCRSGEKIRPDLMSQENLMKFPAYTFAVPWIMKAICYAKVYHPNEAVTAALVLRRYRIVRDQNFKANSVWVF